MKNIMKLFLYAALPLALIELDPAYGWNTIRMGGLPVWMGIGTSSDKRH